MIESVYRPSLCLLLLSSMFTGACDDGVETDPIYSASSASGVTGDQITSWNTAAASDHASAGYLTTELDPVYSASSAAGIEASDVASWDTAALWGDHSLAGYLTAETDALFAASPAAQVTTDQLTQWDAAFVWGDHSLAGYLTTETDALFAASPVAQVTTDQLTQWDAAFVWGDHSLAGYLTAETDALFAASPAFDVTATNVADWTSAHGWGDHAQADYLNGAGLTEGDVPAVDDQGNLVAGSIVDTATGVGVGTSTPTGLLDVNGLLVAGGGVKGEAKRCATPGFQYTQRNTTAGTAACNSYCTDRGYTGGRVQGILSKGSCGGASCIYISDYENCTVTSTGNNGQCGCAANLACECDEIGTIVAGEELRVSGYTRLAHSNGTPPPEDCVGPNQRGRMKTNYNDGTLYICATSGWITK